MNLIDAVVREVLSKPIKRESGGFTWWEVNIISEDMGRKKEEKLIFDKKEDALKITEGHIFQH